jgi:fructokinase
MNTKPIVAGIGELLWDMLPSGKQLGGAPCNFAWHAMQAGCECHVVSAIGTDDLGDELIGTVQKLGISDRFVQRNQYPTSTVSITLNDQGHPDYTIHEHVAWDYIEWDDEIKQLASTLDALCFGSLAQRNAGSKESILSLVRATRPDCLKVFDINLRQHYFTRETIMESLALADVLKLNEDELPVVAGFTGLKGGVRQQLDELIRLMNLKYVVYTMGSQGSILVSIDEFSFIEAPRVTVADTVGAGDAFTAIFTSGILKKKPLTEIHRKATEIAAWVCTQKGATSKWPNSLQ